MSEKLKSRKLWVFIALVALIVCNYLFGLGMPTPDVLYLVILGASYILGQGYVDAKQQPTKDLPVGDILQSFTNIIQAELGKLDFGKNIPPEKILMMLTPIFKQILEGQAAIQPLLAVSPSEIPPVEPESTAQVPNSTQAPQAPIQSDTSPQAQQAP